MYMNLRMFLSLIMFLPLIAQASPGLAAENESQTVKVALLDMSSIAGPGMGPGWRQGMDPGRRPGAGPGMMGGPGPGMGPGGGYGPDMMGPGWGWGGGQGPGWMAQHMMGPGMMGMGMMAIRSSVATAKAGKVRFDVVNYSASLVHELEVIAVDDINAPLPYDYNTATVVPPTASEKGELEDLKPNDEKLLELTLPTGNYLLVCNLPGHYAAGMVAPFTVTH